MSSNQRPKPQDEFSRDPKLAAKLLERQINGMLLVLFVVLPLTLLRVGSSGFSIENAIQWLWFLIFLTVVACSKNQSHRGRGLLVAATAIGIIVAGVAKHGVLAAGHIMVPFVAILTGMLFGRRIALWCFVGTCLTIALLGVLFATGNLHHQNNVQQYVESWIPWVLLLTVQLAGGLWYLFLIVPISEAERAAAERMEGVLQGINDALFIQDKETGAILQVNQKGCAMYGYSAEEAVGMSVGDLSAGVAPYTDADARAWIEKAARQGPQIFEWQAKHRQGQLFWVEVNMRMAVLGGSERLLVLVRDISERRQLEEQLRQAQKMEAIGNLAGGVAHDFNNLLGVIVNCTEFALDKLGPNHPIHSDLLEVMSASERAAGLTRQLLAFSRKQVVQPVPLDLNETAQGLEKMLRRIIGEDIALNLRLAPATGKILADPGQIEQVLLNLVVNARDAMPHGGTLIIETDAVEADETFAAGRPELAPRRYLQLAVSDTGCGMDQQTKARVFEPFFTTKERGKGTGLGLSTVYGIVKQCGGTIGIYSELNRGTSFKIYFPEISPQPSAASHSRQSTSRQSVAPSTILVVEDDAALRRVTQRALETAGHKVFVAEDGPAALAWSANHSGSVRLLVTDVIMPQMSGRVLADRLTAERRDMKVLFMSGYTDDAIVHHGILEPGVHFISKPFTSAQLAEKVDSVLASA